MDEFNTVYMSTKLLIKKTPVEFMMWRKERKNNFERNCLQRRTVYGQTTLSEHVCSHEDKQGRREDEGNIASVNDRYMLCMY